MIAILFSSYALAGTTKRINVPGAVSTCAMDIDGDNIVGYYTDSIFNRQHGFIYDGTNWTILNKPGATNTIAAGIDGKNIVGNYYDSQGTHSFIYDGTTWTTLSYSGSSMYGQIEPHGISGNSIIGKNERDSFSHAGFIYNTETETTHFINYPGSWTEAYGTDGGNIVGVAITTVNYANPHNHGFLYDGSTWTLLDAPGSRWTEAYDINGKNIIGAYDTGTHHSGFLYNGSTWTDIPIAYGISGNKIVGYDGTWGNYQGFVYTIPEPASALLIGAGLLFARLRRVQKPA